MPEAWKPDESFIRVFKLAEHFPVFSISKWKAIVAKGQLPSHKVDGARLVLIADVHAFLARPATTERVE